MIMYDVSVIATSYHNIVPHLDALIKGDQGPINPFSSTLARVCVCVCVHGIVNACKYIDRPSPE